MPQMLIALTVIITVSLGLAGLADANDRCEGVQGPPAIVKSLEGIGL